ncbi:class I SAM-dependent methyltransferase [bacterium]
MNWWKRFFEPEYYGPTLEGLPEERTECEVEFILSALQLKKGASVLDLCCGVGRHTIELARRGFRVTGLDYNEKYLEIARESASEADVDAGFVKEDMRKIPGSRKYDAVINIFTSFGYFESDKENYKVFSAVAGCLKAGGRFFLETMNRDWVVRNYLEREWFDTPDGITLEERDFDVREDTVITRWVWIRDGKETEWESRVKLYPYSTVKRELKKRGLEIENSFGDYDGSEYGIDAGRTIIVASKKRKRSAGRGG